MGQYKTVWPTCQQQVSCDGVYIRPDRPMCSKCEATLAKRNSNKPLKGEHHLNYEATRERRK